MAKRIFQAGSFTPTPTADNTALANSTYMALDNPAATATAFFNVIEIYVGGQAGASAITALNFARDVGASTIPAALAAPNSDGPMHSSTAVLAAPVVTYALAGTGPSRTVATTAARMNLSMNAFGGIVRWVAAPGEEWGVLGNTANASGSSLSCLASPTGAGLIGAHIVYEPA